MVIINGGASGIELATARRFAAEHARVVIAELDPAKESDAWKIVKSADASDALGLERDVNAAGVRRRASLGTLSKVAHR